jgi:hypothetical protein
LVAIGSIASMAFGLWHFTVPRTWNWYSYMDARATELVLAVRAVNAFFSLSLVLFGLVNLLLAFGGRSNRYSLIVVLAATTLLWFVRVGFQLVYPQGTMNPLLQLSMLLAFIVVFLCHAAALVALLATRSPQ